MDVEYAFLADAAETPPNGKLYVLGGGFDEIRAPQFPVTHSYLSLVVKLRFHPAECDRLHRLEIELWDPDGQRLGPHLKTEVAAPRRPHAPTRPSHAQIVLNMVGIQFPRPGEYAFHILVNGQHLRSVPLYLERVPLPGPAGPTEDGPPP